MLKIANSNSGQVSVSFPALVTSSVTDCLREDLNAMRERIERGELSCDTVCLIFEETHMIDSMGLNLLKGFVDWCKPRSIKVVAELYAEFIHMILHSVWLDREMEIVLKYEGEQQNEKSS